jgi:type II secretory pathway component GspD/PulD (secretin)/Leucine-rich repeat (LRR) protein
MLLNNNSNGTIAMIKQEFFVRNYEPIEGEPGKLAPQLQHIQVGWKFNIYAKILENGEKVHIKLATRQQEPGFETRQYRPGYDYQIPSPPDIFVTELTARNGEPFVISRLRHGETAYCLIVTPSAILPERQPEPLLGKKLPQPDNIQNMDNLKQAEGKPTLICFWDMNQRPSRNLVSELAKREKGLAEKNVTVYLVHTSNVEPAKLKEWLDNQNVPFACGSIENDAADVLFRWGVRAQPWLILTDENRTVRAEGFSLEQLDEKLQETGKPAAARTRIVHFPDDRTVGNLKLRDTRPDIGWDRGYLSLPGWALLGPAQGDVSVPAGEDLRLEVSGDVTDFSFLSDLKPNNLQVLILSNKKISDEDLIHLKGLTGLLALSLDTTPIENAGLAHLAALTSLKDLSLFNTKVSDAGLEHLSPLKSLKRLILFITQVRGPGLKCLQNLTSLVSLDLAATPITDESLVHVAEITWLKELQLQDTDITNKGLAHLKSLRSLEMLILGNTNLKQGYSPITDDGLVYLKGLDSLKDLHLLRTRATDTGLAYLSNLKTLEALDLKETRLTGEGLAYLKDLPALTYLNLEKTGVTEVGLKYLKEMTNLRVLSLDGENISENDLKDLEKALPDCKVTVRTANSDNSVPEIPVLSKSAPTAEDKPIVKVDLAWIEIPSGSQVDSKTTNEIKNVLGDKIAIADSPVAADLLRDTAGATAAVKDESAGDKRVTQEQFKTLFDLLASRGLIKILLNPTLEVADGQTAKISSKQKIPNSQDSIEDSIEITPTIRKNGNIVLQVNLDWSLKSAEPDANQPPIIQRRKISTGASISSGESVIIGGMIQQAVSPDADGNVKVLQSPSRELMCIITASIVAPADDETQPMETLNFQNVEVQTAIEKLAEWTGKTIIPPADLMKQKITIYSPEQMPRSEAAAMILNSLRSKGYTAEQTDDTIYLKSLPEEQPGTGKTQIMIDTKILTVSDEFLKYIGLDPNSVASSEGWSDYLVHSTDDSASFIIDKLHADLLLRNVAARMRTNKDIQMLQKPQVLALSGKKVEIHILDSEYYMLIAPNEPNGSSKESESKSHRIELGTTIRLIPTLTPDGENIELDFEWEHRRLRGIKEHTGPDGKKQKVPQIDVDSIKTPCTIPDGKTLLIAGKKIIEQKKKKPGKPGLADMPLIGRFFYSPSQPEQTMNLLIMVTPSTDIKAPSILQTLQPLHSLVDPNDPLIKKLEEKFKRSDGMSKNR